MYCVTSCTTSPDFRAHRLPQSHGFHEDPLRFERWTYLYTENNSHRLRYRWHEGPQIHSLDVDLDANLWHLDGVRLLPKQDSASEVALKPKTRKGELSGFVRREQPNDLWITTRGRFQSCPITRDIIDELIEEPRTIAASRKARPLGLAR